MSERKEYTKLYMFVICSSKRPSRWLPVNYYPILSGSVSKDYYGCLRDDSGDNISFKNSNLSEYSSLYWIWKNTPNIDDDSFIGICHYRRFFTKHRFSPFFVTTKTVNRWLHDKDVVLGPKKIQKIAKKNATNRDCLSEAITVKNEKIFEESLFRQYPSYAGSANAFLESGSYSQCNLMILRKKDFNKYMTFYFSIIDDIKEKVDYQSLKPWQTRIFGYIGEFLLNIWVISSGLRATEKHYKTYRNLKRVIYFFLPKNLKKKIFKKDLYENGAQTKPFQENGNPKKRK